MAVDVELLRKIDRIALSERAARLRKQFFDSKPGVAAERVKLVKEGWEEFGEGNIDLLRATGLKKVLEGVPVVLWPGQLMAGNETKYYRGSFPHPDYDSSYLAKIMSEQKGTMTLGGPQERGEVTADDWQILIDSAPFFKGKVATEKIKEVVSTLMGSWYDELVAAGCTRYEAAGNVFSCPRFDKVVSDGLESLIEEIEGRMELWTAACDSDVSKFYFWQAAKMVLEGTITLAKRYSRYAAQLADEEADPARRAELREIARICDHVPGKPATSFREGLQSIMLTHLAMKLEAPHVPPTGWGRPDQYLFPCFKRDIEEGRISLEQATDLISDFLLYCVRLEWVVDISRRDYNQKGVLTSLSLGGVDENGNDVSNELSYLFLHVMGLVGYAEPHLVIQWHKGLPRWLMGKAIETNWKVGGGVPQFQNGDHLVGYMVNRGVSLKAARNWQSHGCSQAVPDDQRTGMTPSYFNIPLCLDLALHNGTSYKTGKRLGTTTGDPRNFQTFREFYEAFQKQVDYVIKRQLWHDKLVDQIRKDYYRRPLSSALAPGCIEKGMDFIAGGLPHYRIWMKKDRGLVPTADSLMAIKKLVYDEKRLTMAQLLEALDTNFAGEKGDEIRRLCLACPKYGNDNDEIDRMLRDLAKFTSGLINAEKNVFGYPFAVNRNGQAWHYMAGKALAAIPSGRKSGESLPDGSLSPMQGMDIKGPTAVLNSALKADFRESIASVMTVKIPQPLLNAEETRDKVVSLTDSFMRGGGTYLQYNILDAQKLREAKRNPEEYRDLLVRVGGYSAYFVSLSPEIQDEIIRRTEHGF